MKKNLLKLSRAGALLLAIGIFAGCSETQIIDDPSLQSNGDEIVFHVSAPQKMITKASSDLKIRYTAKLFNGSYEGNPQGVQYLETQQITAGDDGKGTITFKVEPGQYQILIFADYIYANAQPIEGTLLYKDEFYDTSKTDDGIELKGFNRLKDGNNNNSINNDNYDCFYAETELINKTEEVYEKNITLTRAAAKVRFISETTGESPLKEIKFTKFSYFYTLGLHGQTCTRDDFNISSSSFLFVGMSDEENNELFYFYTLAPAKEDNHKLGDISFTITYENDKTRTVEIPGGTIPVLQNHITTVKGAFLADRPRELGDIILHLETSDKWDEWPEDNKEIIIE